MCDHVTTVNYLYINSVMQRVFKLRTGQFSNRYKMDSWSGIDTTNTHSQQLVLDQSPCDTDPASSTTGTWSKPSRYNRLSVSWMVTLELTVNGALRSSALTFSLNHHGCSKDVSLTSINWRSIIHSSLRNFVLKQQSRNLWRYTVYVKWDTLYEYDVTAWRNTKTS